MKNNIKRVYLKNIKGLPKMKKLGANTRQGLPRHHVYKVTIENIVYFKVHLHRGDTSAIKYFKRKKDAKVYVQNLELCGRW